MSVLEKDTWTEDVDLLLSDIIEYDMRRAGLSIIRQDKLLSDNEIQRLANLDKHESDKAIGKLYLKNKQFKELHMKGFQKYRIRFGELNELNDSDILSIKKDAIFVKKYCDITQIADNIEFREKNHYEAFLKIRKMEIYWSPTRMDVKGISDERLELHRPYMLETISRFVRLLSQYDYEKATKFIVKVMNDYKIRNLPVGYYREFSSDSNYVHNVNGKVMLLHNVGESFKSQIDIAYNYLNVLVPLLQLVMG